jgi:flagellar protein FlaI
MITTLTPLMDASLKSGDRVNATLMPISTKGNTITIRKFAESPWSITDFILTGTIDYYSAAMVWTAIQYELSMLIVGGTGSGKTSTLNVFSVFIPPNQRVVSIEDTRELRLPRTLHWVPMETRLPNPEGKGEISMLDLIVNSLRMRPDRIIVGEIRRKREAEVLFEAMHTGHSVYATLHANTVNEAIIRLTTEPIGIAKSLLAAVDLIFVQNRNRRTNTRRTFQVAEVLENGDFNLLFNYNFKTDKLMKIKEPYMFYKTIELFSGLGNDEVDKEINDKIKILKYITDHKITNNEEIALMVSYYYMNKDYLMKKLFSGGDKNTE